jgi:hypothetical protein
MSPFASMKAQKDPPPKSKNTFQMSLPTTMESGAVDLKIAFLKTENKREHKDMAPLGNRVARE